MRILLLNQAFYPDVASTSQHGADLAAALAEAGHSVTAMASRREYDDPKRTFAAAETWRGVRIIRVASTAFGKAKRFRRAMDFTSFLLNCALRLLILPAQEAVVAMTTPPLLSFLAAVFVSIKGGRLICWILDLNPDQALAAGWLRPGSYPARLLEGMLRFSLRRAETIIVLDRFMKDRIVARGIPNEKVVILPPWTHDSAVRYEERAREQFRREHGLSDKFVVMYSGNHSPCHPLDTLLEAAQRLRDHTRIAFCFVGGGSEFRRVQEFAARNSLTNILCLGYQPLARLSASLSSADLHTLVMGDPFVGIVHPCKIYNILSLGIPFLYIGPEPSHVSDMMPREARGEGALFARHGDVGRVSEQILSAASRPARRPVLHRVIADQYGQALLIRRMMSVIEFPAAGATTTAVASAVE